MQRRSHATTHATTQKPWIKSTTIGPGYLVSVPEVDEESVFCPDRLELVVQLVGAAGEGHPFRPPSKQASTSRVHGEEDLADAPPSLRAKVSTGLRKFVFVI